MTAPRRWSAAAVAAAHAGLLLALVSAAPPPAPAGGSMRPPLWVRLLSDAPALPAPALAPAPVTTFVPPAVPVLAVPAVALATAATVPVATAPMPAPEPVSVAVSPQPSTEPPVNAPDVRREPPGHAGCAQAPHPPLLRERGIEGQVQLRVQVGADGHARQVLLLQSSGWRLFDEAALAQARGCRFRPAREGDAPVDAWVEFPVRFTLRG